MRHSCIFATVPLFALTLAGCGPDDSSDSNFINPATSVALKFESFDIQNEDGLPPVLPQTIFYDFYRGVEPADGEDDEGIATQLRERLNTLMGLTPSNDGTRYTSARNPMDFLQHVISSNQVDSFNRGRRLMRDSMNSGDPATYNTPDKNAQIHFTETGGNNGTEPEPDQIWVYPLLDWTSNPQLNKIFRSFQFIARAPDQNDSSPSEIASAFWSGRFANESFSVSGYNRPEFASLSFTGRSLGHGELFQEFIRNKSDMLTFLDTSGITVDGQEPDCIRVRVDYEAAEVRVFTSSGEDPTIEDDETGETSPNPAHCGNQQNGSEAIFYQSVTIDERQ